MEKDTNKPLADMPVYKSGNRREVKKKVVPSKLKYGTLGIDAIVKPNN